MVNTHSAAGRMVLMNLANYAQLERELISERTRDALQHLKTQGVRLGHAPYGYELSDQRDERGRRILIPLESEQAVLRKVQAMRADGLSLRQIARRLNQEGVLARRGGTWRAQRISIVLQRDGKHTPRATKPHGPRVPLHYDREVATARAKELRAEGLSLNRIGLRLHKERLTPLRGGIWHAAQVGELLRGALPGDREAAALRASELRAQGIQLRDIGV